jgi:zinc transport system substrate-binding protein
LKRRIGIVSFLLILIVGLIAGCGTESVSSKEDGKWQVATSLYPFEYFVKEIGKEHVQVTNVIPVGVEPHDFELTAKDVAKLHEIDLFVYQSAGFESIDKVANSLQDVQLVDVSKGIQLLDGEAHHHEDEERDDHDHDEVDPHIWLDPQLAKKQAAHIRDALMKLDAKNSQDYEKNYNELAAKLDQLDQEYLQMVGKAKQKKFVTSHAAFGYLAKRYQLEQISVAGLSPSSEPSPQAVKEIIETMREHQLKYILFETLVSGKVAETIQSEVKAEMLIMNPLEGLTQEEIKNNEDYFSVMRKNKENLAKALGVQP